MCTYIAAATAADALLLQMAKVCEKQLKASEIKLADTLASGLPVTHTRARAHKARARISRTAAPRRARPRPRAFGCRRKWHLWAEASVRAAMADSYEKERTVNGSSFAKSEIERMAALLQKAQSPHPPPPCS